MTAQRLSPASLREVLDRLAEGFTIKEAAATVGLSESGLWTWKAKSRAAERDCDLTVFWLTWNFRQNFFHCLMEIAQQQPQPPQTHGDEITFEEAPSNKPLSHSPFPMLSEMQKELRDKLRQEATAHLSNPNRVTRPIGVVPIMRDAPDDAQRERVNNPSDQTGLPTHAPAPAASVDYSRRARPLPPQLTPRVDVGGLGYGKPPKGGYRVA